MDDPADKSQLTPRFYQCRACGAVLRMRIEPPVWVCRNCLTRHIPTDLEPCDNPPSGLAQKPATWP